MSNPEVENQMPLFHEPLTVEQIDENMAGILEYCPQFFPALLQRGQYHVGIGKNSQAIEFYNRGFELMIEIIEGEELFDTVDRFINGLERHLRYDLCCRYLKRLIELYPKKALFYDYLAGSILQSKNSSIQEEITFQTKAIELEPENATFLSNLGWIHLTESESRETTIKSAFIKAGTRKNIIKIEAPDTIRKHIQHNEKLKIKIEVDINPPGGFSTEVKILLQPIPFSVNTFTFFYSGP